MHKDFEMTGISHIPKLILELASVNIAIISLATVASLTNP